MLQIGSCSLFIPLEIIYKAYLERGCFPLECIKAIIVPAHKKRLLKSSRPRPTLPSSGKVTISVLFNT